MKLKRLVLQGFKSFKDKTVIHFDDGITGIVGPNGCGKSNIVDALFWVMGEQSAKHLRGKTMKDVIFSGSSKYSPASWSEVSLILENTDLKHVNIGGKVSRPAEIQLTRKLYRNSETEYRINNLPARLKDIQEVFMDTGAGAKSYSIIAQGEIDRLVKAKPEERRTMIEEVAGITKFKVRRRESLKKIENTQLNLARLQDIQIEIDRNLKSLEDQAEKANRAKVLKEKIKKNELIVSSHKEYEILKELRETFQHINEKKIEIENWNTEKQKLEVDLESERLERDELTHQIEDLQTAYNNISRELAAEEERLEHQRKTLADKSDSLERARTEKEELAEEKLDREKKLNQVKEEESELVKSAGVEIDLSEEEARVDQIKEQMETAQADWDEALNKQRTLKQELIESESQTYQIASRIEEISSSLETIDGEIEEEEKSSSQNNEKVLNQKQESEKRALELEEIERSHEDHSSKLQDLAEEQEEVNEKLETAKVDVIKKKTKLDSLEELQSNREGVLEGTKLYLAENDSSASCLSDLLTYSDDFQSCVQIGLGKISESMIPLTEEFSFEEIFKEDFNQKGLEALRPLSKTPSHEIVERLSLMGFGEVVPASEAISYREGMNGPDLTKLLNGIYFVDQISPESLKAIPDELDFDIIVSKEGDILEKFQGSIKVSLKANLNSGKSRIERAKIIDELKKEISELEVTVADLEKQSLELAEQIDPLKESTEEMKQRLYELRATHQADLKLLESLESSLESSFSKKNALQKRKKESSQKRLELMEQEDNLNQKIKTLRTDLSAVEILEGEKQSEFKDLEVSYREEKEELIQKQVQAKSLETNLKNIKEQITDLGEQLKRIDAKTERLAQTQDELSSEIEEVSKSIETLRESNKAKSENLSERENHLREFKDKLAELLSGMQDREERVKKLNKFVAKGEKELVQKEVKIEQFVGEEEQVVKNIFEKFSIDLRKSLGEFLELEENDYSNLNDISDMYFRETENGRQEIAVMPFQFVRKYGQDLKDCHSKLKRMKNEYSQLGDINWQAIEEFEKQKIRSDFLKIQERELRSSLQDLEEAIRNIDEKSKIRFKEAYFEVNKRFEKVFPIIFGGGEASLKLVGDPEAEDCGIDIIAQPPGKKMQNINLMSGGEKAMTAVSLIFSIFLVKPSPFCLLDEVDAPLDDANVGRFNELLREMSADSQFILITHNKKTMEMNDVLYGVTMQEPGISKAVSVHLQ